MVLRLARSLVVVAVLGCVPRTPIVYVKTPTRVAVAYTVDYDDERALADVPGELRAAVTGVLKERNLVAVEAPFSEYQGLFTNKRSTAQRLSELERVGVGAPLLLLVETQASYYSQINGRYRWTVLTKVTWSQRGKHQDAITRSFDLPAVLDFDHQKEAAAVRSGAGTIAARVARLADVFLPGVELETTRVAHAPATVEHEDDYDAIYFVLVDRFDNGDKKNDGAVDLGDPNAFHGGDLRGVINRLDYIRDLGFRTLWLSPVSAMRTKKFHGHGAFHGYWTLDLALVEPRFGSMADLRELTDEAHKRGMRVMLDVVLNHVSFDAPLRTEHPEWFHKHGPITDYNDPFQLVNHEVHGLPDLAQEREDVYQFLLARSLRLIDQVNPDGFRLDAVKHVPASFWRRYTKDIRRRALPRFMLLGEMYDGNAETLAKTQRTHGFQGLFDFPLYFAAIDVFCNNKPVGRLADVLFADRYYDAPDHLVTLLDNHDLPRLMTRCHNDVEAVKQALLFQLTMRGIPSMTYGTEASLVGQSEPDNRGDMRFAKSPLVDLIRKLLTLRREHASLRRGKARLLALRDGLLSYVRVTHKEALVVAINRGHDTAHVAWPAELRKNLLAHDAVSGGKLSPQGMSVLPHTIRVALLQSADGSRLPDGPDLTLTRAVKIRVKQGPIGSDLLLVGSGGKLGSWQPERAPRLHAEKDDHVHVMSLPPGAAFSYKLAARSSDGTVTWETGNNRYLFVEYERGLKAITLTWRK